MEKKLLEYWAESVNIPYETVIKRIKEDRMSYHDALFTPVENSAWRSYINGNCITSINLDDGTKMHSTIDPNEDKFDFAFAESCDLNITNKCDNNCPWCYLNCTKDSPHGDLLNVKFFDTLHPYTELAINGNDLTHPQLLDFLKLMKEKNILVSMTLNQNHFLKHLDFVKDLYNKKLINGLGISLTTVTDDLIEKIKMFPNAVLHVIAGIISLNELTKLANKNFKLLILGYKEVGRGISYKENSSHSEQIQKNINTLKKYLPALIHLYKCICFDNLATKQLDIRKLFGEKMWQDYYMGEDGTHTFYIDLVKQEFSQTSMSTIRYPLLDKIDDMFDIIKRTKLV